MAPLLISAAAAQGLEALKARVWQELPAPLARDETEKAQVAGEMPATWTLVSLNPRAGRDAGSDELPDQSS
jgi:hypothetical protein